MLALGRKIYFSNVIKVQIKWIYFTKKESGQIYNEIAEV